MRKKSILSILTVFIAVLPALAQETDSLRLDPGVTPSYQSIHLDIDAAKTEYSGSTRIKLVAKRPTRNFRFHAEDLSIRTMTLTNASGKTLPLEYRAAETGLIRVETGVELTPGEYSLDIAFVNDFDTRATSLYRVETGGHAYAFTQFEAWDARSAFPCWDEPSVKITYQFTLRVPESHLAITNTPVLSETRDGGYRAVVFKPTPPMPSYLLALATGPLDTVSIPGLSVPGRIVTVKGNAPFAGDAAAITPVALRAMEDFFGRPYPYEKLDIIGVPEFLAGAMENPGAITFRDDLLLIDPEAASAAQRRTLTDIMAHELAHMWFGNLVTMAWWDDLWLNESFADWLCVKITDRIAPEYRSSLDEIRSIQSVMEEDARLSTRPVSKPVSPRDNQDELFDYLVYDKGQAVLDMFEKWIGPKPFRAGVLDYIRNHEWGNATSGDLWQSLGKEAGTDIGTAMSTFIHQPGVPLVALEFLPDSKIRLSQRRFLNAGVTPSSWSLWHIPVTLKYPDGGDIRTSTVFLTGETQTVTLSVSRPPPWAHPNAGEFGYYRWTVPPDMLMKLTREALPALDVRERVGLIGHLSALMDAGLLAGDLYLQAIEGFSGDADPAVIEALIDAAEKCWQDIVAETPDLSAPYEGYARRLLGPSLSRIGTTRREGEGETVSILRARLIEFLGDKGRDAEILRMARSIARAYMRNASEVDPALVRISLRIAATQGDKALFDTYRERLEQTTHPVERINFVSALGRFRSPETLEALLAYMLDGRLRPQEYDIVLSTIVEHTPECRDRISAWLSEHYADITEKLPSEQAMYMPWWMANGASAERLERARRFFSDPDHSPPGTENELNKVMEDVNRRIVLMTREGVAMAAFLKR